MAASVAGESTPPLKPQTEDFAELYKAVTALVRRATLPWTNDPFMSPYRDDIMRDYCSKISPDDDNEFLAARFGRDGEAEELIGIGVED